MREHCPVVVLISGNGSNLQALIDASVNSNFNIVGVISNKADAFGLERASKKAIPTFVIDHRDFPDRVTFDRALIAQIDQLDPALVVLAGFMRILSSEFVQHYPNNILNIHPSLLPKYPGTNTHQRVLNAGDQEHGVSVHFVTEELDGGPIAGHAKIMVSPEDTAETLAEKIHRKEHLLYPHVVSLFASGRLEMVNNKAWIDHQEMAKTGLELR
ncbi:MAG: phosphoribosylglycinamide formyltransferase [Gammaproteobacteria bacterium]|nr:phosphoribosylglycinamide formyltransferase [Gammaproteobacteria bacterium]